MGWFGAFYGTSIGKKIIVAITGSIMVLYLVGHMLGNLQIFAGPGTPTDPAQINKYAAFLRTSMPILTAIRIVLLVTFVVHVVTTVVLYFENRAARPQAYAKRGYREANIYSRTMIWGGIALLGYVVYHVLHLTAGTVHHGLFEHHDAYGNIVRGFQVPWISALYIVATIALYFHLHHAILSIFQTLGVHHSRHIEALRGFSRALALVIVIGFLSVPVSVLLGLVR